jgi:hypothetical protein
MCILNWNSLKSRIFDYFHQVRLKSKAFNLADEKLCFSSGTACASNFVFHQVRLLQSKSHVPFQAPVAQTKFEAHKAKPVPERHVVFIVKKGQLMTRLY